MFELVRQRSRYQAQFIALDEVFDALDKNGQRAVRSVLDMLTERVKKVFVVSHAADVIGKYSLNFVYLIIRNRTRLYGWHNSIRNGEERERKATWNSSQYGPASQLIA